MAGITKIAELQARKRALVTESEICRESLKSEVENLRLELASVVGKLDKARRVASLVMMAAPVAGFAFRRRAQQAPTKPSRFKRMIGSAMIGVRLYRKYAPMAKSMLGQLRARRRAQSEAPSASE